MFACHFANFSNRIDEAAVSWNMSNSNEFNRVMIVVAASKNVAQSFDGDLPMCIIRNNFNYRTSFLGDLQKGDIVAGIFGHSSQDAVAGLKRNRVEGHIPGASGIFDKSNLVARTANECGNGIIKMFKRCMSLFGSLVASYLCLKLQVCDSGIKDRLWHE